MSLNVGSISVGMNVDLAEFQAGMQKATALASSQAGLMSAEMKRSSREGAESLRLIDEAISVHMSRPLTRIIAQIPGVGEALKGLMGVGVTGAIGAVAIESFEKVGRAIEKAKESQEKFAESSRRADETIETVLGGLANKLAEVSGDHRLKFSIQGAEESKRAIEEIAKAMDEASKSAKDADGWMNRFLLRMEEGAKNRLSQGLGFLDSQYGSSVKPNAMHDAVFDTQQVENMNDAFKDMRADLEIALNTDAAKGTHTALVLLKNDAKAATEYLEDMQRAGENAAASIAQSNLTFFNASLTAAQQAQKIAGVEAAKAAADAAAAAHKAEVAKFQAEHKFYNEEANAEDEDYLKAVEGLAKDVLSTNAERFSKAKGLYFPEADSALPPQGAPAPQFADQAELDKISGTGIDAQTESWKKASEVIASLETPVQKYSIALTTLYQLEAEGRLSTEQLVAAQQKLGDALVQSANHVHKMQEELQHLLERSDDAATGVEAFFKQLQIDAAENGKFTFDLLTQGLKGFNDEVAKSILTGKASWKEYFRSLDDMALKFFLTKTENSLFQDFAQTGIGKDVIGFFTKHAGQPDQAPAPALPPTAPGSATGLGALTPGANAGSVASTQFQSSVTQFATAVSQFSAKAGGGIGIPGLTNGGDSAGDASGAMDGTDAQAAGLTPGYAGGGNFDMTPGASMIVGEDGPELMRFGVSASGLVTPNSALGGTTHQHYYDLRGADPAAVEKLYRMLPEIERRARQGATADASEIAKRNLR